MKTLFLFLVSFALISVTQFVIFAEELPELTWGMLLEYNSDDGIIPESLVKYQNKNIRISGFIVPLDFGEDFYTVTEMLLVPDPLACIHVPPPPPNQMIYVKLQEAISVDMDLRGIELSGKFRIKEGQTEYGDISFEMKGKKAVALEDYYIDPFDALDAEIDAMNALDGETDIFHD